MKKEYEISSLQKKWKKKRISAVHLKSFEVDSRFGAFFLFQGGGGLFDITRSSNHKEGNNRD